MSVNIPKANNFAEHRPCVVLLKTVDLKSAESVLADEDDKPIEFPKFTKARKFVSQNVPPELHYRITYANVVPEAGAGDREATNNKRCLQCKGFLRPTAGEVINVGGSEIQTETYVCPKCDAQ